MCWIHGNSLYFGFLLPVGIMLLANIVIFCILLKEVVGRASQVCSVLF